MNSKIKVANLCLLTLFASTFAVQATSSKKSTITTKSTKYAIEKVDDNISSYSDHNCGTDHNGQDWNKLQQRFINQVKKSSLKTTRMSRSLTSTPAVEGSVAIDGRYYIPVVVHIYGEEYNCSDDSEKCLTDDKINDAILKLNNDFQGLAVDETAVSPQFAAIRENLNIEFVLAKKDPDGNATTGIVRYDHEKAGYANIDEAIQEEISADSWDNFKYMNLYLQHDLHDDGVGNNSGVAWYPDVSMSQEGTSRVVYNGHYTGLNTSENFRSVLTHEFGHWLNLIHTFETKTCSITNEAFCATTGDKTCDTPQMSLPSQMQANAKNCLGQPTNTENFMHYTDNYAMFTQQQVSRMTAALHGPARSTLWSNDNLIATGLELYTTNSDRPWDGSVGLDVEPQGTVLQTIENISGTLDEVITHEINLPQGASNILFHLDGHTTDPDLYISKGTVPTHDGEGKWVADYISFNSPGTAEAVSIDIPDSNKSYYASIHAFTEFDNSRLRVIQGNDAFLTEGESRFSLFKIDNLKANKVDAAWADRPGKTHNFQFTVPDEATRVVVVVPPGYHGPVMASGVPNYNGDLDLHVSRNGEVSLDTYDCRPFSWKGLAEYCEFDGGGTYNVMIDPFETYTEATLHVYYETADTSNQLPYANTNGDKYKEAVDHAVQFSSYGSNDPDGDIVSYLWDFGDGTQSEEADIDHTYTAVGNYDVTLTVTDNSGEATTASTLAIITENSPNDAQLCTDCTRVYLTDEINLTAVEGETPNTYYFEVPDAASLVTFELVNGYNGDPDIHVSQNQDVSLEQFTCRPWEAPGQTELCQLTSGGIYNVMINPFHDYESVRFRAYYDIRVDADHSAPNKLPKANAGGNYTGIAGDIVQFSGLSSADTDGTIASYLWDFGHGVTSTGATVDHVYPTAGTYFVTLTVTDNDGATNFSSTTVNIAAVGDMDNDGDVDIDDIAALSTAVSQGTSVDSSFDLNNDGVVNAADVSLMSDICSYNNCSNIAPPPQAPVAATAALNNNVQINTDVMFSSEGSSDQYGQIVTYAWDFGDGTTSNWSAPTHQFTVPGIYDVVLTLTDNDDMTATSTVQVNVDHAPLTEVCSTVPAVDERDLIASVPTCVGNGNNLNIAQVHQHKTIAISMINAPADSLLYFGAGDRPNANNGTYTAVSTANADQQCIFYTIPEDAGSWGYLQITGTPAGATIVVDYDVASCRPLAGELPNDNSLQNGVSQVAAGTRGEEVHFTMNVPANVSGLTFGTAGGTGDADMYVKFGAEPTTSDYDCRPYKGGNVENCEITDAQEGTYHVMLRGYQDFSDVNVTGNYTIDSNSANVAPVAQTNGPFIADVANNIAMNSTSSDEDGSIVTYLWSFGDGTTANTGNVTHAYSTAGTYTVTLTVTDNEGASTTTSTVATISEVIVNTSLLENGIEMLASGLSDEEVTFTMNVPAGASNLIFNTSGGSGDADLHVKFGTEATRTEYDCRPWKNGSTETCTIQNVQAGIYHIMLLGHNDFSNVSLVGTYTP
jgi:PKD repeat protein